jgi:hypothetical protein
MAGPLAGASGPRRIGVEEIPATKSAEAAEERNRFAREIAEGAGLSPSVVGDFAANMDRASGSSGQFEAVHIRPA